MGGTFGTLFAVSVSFTEHTPRPTFWIRLSITMSVSNGVDERGFVFVCDVIRFVRTIRPEPGIRRLVDQLVAAAGSICANRQEALGASSKREFIRFNEIALRGANESFLWLRVFKAVGTGDGQQGIVLLDEARQLAKILGAIVVRSKRSNS